MKQFCIQIAKNDYTFVMYIFELFTCIIPNVSKKSPNPDKSQFPQVNSQFTWSSDAAVERKSHVG